MRKIAIFISTFGGVGYFPVASGTAGTITAIPFAYLFCLVGWYWQIAILLFLFPLFSFFAGEGEKHFGSKDPREVVSDEVLGYLVAVFAISPTAFNLGIAFLLFRIYDIVKPYPIRYADRNIPGGWGIVADDVMAGIFTRLTMLLISMLLKAN
jgi:phosphatidylglycerophosphatase A